MHLSTTHRCINCGQARTSLSFSLLAASMFAPRSSSSATTSPWPWVVARHSAPTPSCNSHTQQSSAALSWPKHFMQSSAMPAALAHRCMTWQAGSKHRGMHSRQSKQQQLRSVVRVCLAVASTAAYLTHPQRVASMRSWALTKLRHH